MRLFQKIFLCFTVLFSISFQLSGFLLINHAYDNAIEQERKYAMQSFQYNKYILQSMMIAQKDVYDKKMFASQVAIYDETYASIFNSLQGKEEWQIDAVTIDSISCQTKEIADAYYIYVKGNVSQGEKNLYLISETDITSIIKNQREFMNFFHKLYFGMLLLAFPIIWLLSQFLTKNIASVSIGAKRIADGDYGERLQMHGKDEISELAVSFNRMADMVEQKIVELTKQAKEKEDFIANFSHEIKTPMTSIVGYADMLYQKELPREQEKKAAEYILNEGMRLEMLARKLMDLFVLEKQDFVLSQINIGDFFNDIESDIELLCVKQGARAGINIDEADISMDIDFLKSMVLNLIDNSLKAEANIIYIEGYCSENFYKLVIKDNGRGIPTQELDRITEAFYMVDKSRSRMLHGAGLGLALVKKIAQIHNADLKIFSDGVTGTTVTVTFEGRYDDEK